MMSLTRNAESTPESRITIASKPVLDVAKLQSWKTGVVNKLTGGVRTLLKGNGSTVIDGTAKLEKPGPDGHRITVTTKSGTETIIAKNIVLATGSRPLEIPGFKIDQNRIIDSTGALAEFRAPTLVLHGAEDAIITEDEARSMAEALPNAELIMIPGSGHLTAVEQPQLG